MVAVGRSERVHRGASSVVAIKRLDAIALMLRKGRVRGVRRSTIKARSIVARARAIMALRFAIVQVVEATIAIIPLGRHPRSATMACAISEIGVNVIHRVLVRAAVIIPSLVGVIRPLRPPSTASRTQSGALRIITAFLWSLFRLPLWIMRRRSGFLQIRLRWTGRRHCRRGRRVNARRGRGGRILRTPERLGVARALWSRASLSRLSAGRR